jgi:hypothetical protein
VVVVVVVGVGFGAGKERVTVGSSMSWLGVEDARANCPFKF